MSGNTDNLSKNDPAISRVGFGIMTLDGLIRRDQIK